MAGAEASATDQPSGLLGSLSGIVATLLEMLGTRLQLFGMDLQTQAQRLLVALFAGLAALALALVIVVGGTMLTVLVLWQRYGAWSVVALLACMLVMGIACALLCVRALRGGPRPFAASLAEIEKDLARLRRNS